MIKSFYIQNYRSILSETISLDFREGKAPNGYKTMPLRPFLVDSCGKKRVPVLAFLGANASGKTNLLKAARCFHRILRSGISRNFFPNKLNDRFKTTIFKISFSYNAELISYLIEYDNNSIIKEELSSSNKELLTIHNGNLQFFKFTQKGYEFGELEKVLKIECTENNNQIKCLLPVITSKYPGLSDQLSAISKIIRMNPETFPRNLVPPTFSLDLLDTDSERVERLRRISQIVHQFDIDVERFSVSKSIVEVDPTLDINILDRPKGVVSSRIINSEKGIKQELAFIHAIVKNIKGEPVTFDFGKDLSSGTQRLFGLIGVILHALDNGHSLFIDEIDEKLHPFIVQKILEMFKDPDYNRTGKAQLICTVLNPLALVGLRVSEIALVEKTLTQGTILKYLSDFEGVRNTTDFVKQYMEGRFSALPSPYL